MLHRKISTFEDWNADKRVRCILKKMGSDHGQDADFIKGRRGEIRYLQIRQVQTKLAEYLYDTEQKTIFVICEHGRYYASSCRATQRNHRDDI